MAETVFRILNWIFSIMGILAVLGFIVELPAAIIFAVVYSQEKDGTKKQKKLKWGISILLAPFLLVIFSLVGLVITNAIKILISN